MAKQQSILPFVTHLIILVFLDIFLLPLNEVYFSPGVIFMLPTVADLVSNPGMTSAVSGTR